MYYCTSFDYIILILIIFVEKQIMLFRIPVNTRLDKMVATYTGTRYTPSVSADNKVIYKLIGLTIILSTIIL